MTALLHCVRGNHGGPVASPLTTSAAPASLGPGGTMIRALLRFGWRFMMVVVPLYG
ncbi:MAG: hypothetical protein ABSB58_09015 [Gemmatimonadales bacterium]